MKTKDQSKYSALSLGFRVDTMGLLAEIADCGLPQNMGVMKMPLNIFKNILGEVAQRAIEVNDPHLNILMLKLALYEVPANEIPSAIENQMRLRDKEPSIKRLTKEPSMELNNNKDCPECGGRGRQKRCLTCGHIGGQPLQTVESSLPKEPDQPSILEEVKRLRDEYNERWNLLYDNVDKAKSIKEKQRLMHKQDHFRNFAKELNEIINKHQ